MMELIERAIPVIQHPPYESPGPDRGSARNDEQADIEVALARAHTALERMRTRHAQLTSGAILQQYQRLQAFDAEDSRPATRVLSVQG
jgi:hypothetical protein